MLFVQIRFDVSFMRNSFILSYSLSVMYFSMKGTVPCLLANGNFYYLVAPVGLSVALLHVMPFVLVWNPCICRLSQVNYYWPCIKPAQEDVLYIFMICTLNGTLILSQSLRSMLWA